LDYGSIVSAKIHPAIGVARVGNAEPGENGPDYFIGPEVPNPVPPPKGGYRDVQGRLKRQAARFRIYGYDRAGNVVGEITAPHAEIEWHVNVANLKAAWYEFDTAFDLVETTGMSTALRNVLVQGTDRSRLEIKPGPCSVNRRNQIAKFDSGAFYGQAVYLGEIHYSTAGRLVFLGGRGQSAPADPSIKLAGSTNNDGWHDDVCDGSVEATVWLGGRKIPVAPAWVVTAPPNYAPNLVATQTLYQVLTNTFDGDKRANDTPSFTDDILPIFRQFADSQWVNAGFAAQFGWRGLTDFTRADFIAKLAAKPGKVDAFQELRLLIFYQFRDPASTVFEPHLWPPLYGEWDPPQPTPNPAKSMMSITPLSYSFLKKWSAGHFLADYDPARKDPQSLDQVAVDVQPDTLDKAALHFCVGGPFHPGPEFPWIVRQASIYESRLRFRRRRQGLPATDYGDFLTRDKVLADGGPLSAIGPGDLTKWLGVPWQTDAVGCGAGYPDPRYPADPFIPSFWPARIPNTILTEKSYSSVANPGLPATVRREAFQNREKWLAPFDGKDPLIYVIDHFHELGTIEPKKRNLGANFPDVIFVEKRPSRRRNRKSIGGKTAPQVKKRSQ